jgi:hypothetical protein
MKHDPKLLSGWSIYLIVLHMIGQSKLNERLHYDDMIPNCCLIGQYIKQSCISLDDQR